MTESEKFEFCSAPWIAMADAFLQESARDAALGGIDYTFNEVFSNAPAHLVNDGANRAGWFIRVKGGQVEAGAGVLEDADVVITADYSAILPLARQVFGDDPAAAARAGETIQELTAAGQFSHVARIEEPPELPWSATLHDALARRTR